MSLIVELEGKEYKMPEGWHEVNLDMFEKIIKHIGLLSEYKSQYQYSVEMLAILIGCSYDDLKKMTRGSFEELSNLVGWASENVVPNGIREWTIDGEEWMSVKNLDSLNMGDVVSLEIMIANSNPHDLLTNILPILIRRVKLVQKGGQTCKIPSDFNADEYNEIKELFKKNLMVSDVSELRDFF